VTGAHSRLLSTAIACAFALVGCAKDGGPVRIGAKGFTEQRLLTEIARRVIDDAGARTRIVACGDTFGCQQALRRGELDLMFEYTGTGYLYSGAILDARPDVETLRSLYAPLGLRWLDPLGFDNGYILVMPRARAETLGVATIEDLAGVPHPLRFAVPRTFLGRPSDGYGALLERHGISARAEPAVIDDAAERIDTMLTGRADVAVVYRTDGELEGLDLTILRDSLSFFPPYQAAVVVRESFAHSHPQVIAALDQLSGTLDNDRVQQLNYEIAALGREPSAVVDALLEELGLEKDEPPIQGSPLRVAIARDDRLDDELGLAVQMLRHAFPGRPIVVNRVLDPAVALQSGRTRLALVGAERFFSSTPPIHRRGDIEAVSVVARRMIHVLRRSGDQRGDLEGRVGLVGVGSGSARAGRELIAAAGALDGGHGSLGEELDALAAGTIDAVIALARPGAEEVAAALQGGQVELRGLADPAVRAQLPHLRPARIAPGTYAGQTDALETLGAQVVLAGPAPPMHASARGGPVASLGGGASEPLTVDEAQRLVDASEAKQIPDAVLPSIWNRLSSPHSVEADLHPALDTGLNLGVFVFLGWLVVLTLRRDPS